MTINEFMTNLIEETDAMADDLACESIMYDFYASECEETVATESLNLTFDDMEEETVDTPAFEAASEGLGGKLKKAVKAVVSVFKNIGMAIDNFISKIMAEKKNSEDALSKSDDIVQRKSADRANAEMQHDDGNYSEDEYKEEVGKVDEKYAAEVTDICKRMVPAVNMAYIKFVTAFNDIVKCEAKMLEIFNQCTKAKVKTSTGSHKIGDIADNPSVLQQNTPAKSADGKDVIDVTPAEIKGSLEKYRRAADELLKVVESKVAETEKIQDSFVATRSKARALFSELKAPTSGDPKKTPKSSKAAMRLRKSIARKMSKYNLDDLRKTATEMRDRCNEFAAKTEASGNALTNMGNGTDNLSVLGGIFSAYSKIAKAIADVAHKFINITYGDVWVFA